MHNITVPFPYQELYWWATAGNYSPPFRYYCYSGGRASGKSTTVAQSLILRAASQPIRVLCAREYQNSIQDSVHRLLADQIQALQLAGFTVTRDQITHTNGSLFIFRGLHHNLQSVKSMEGVDVAWVEESQTLTRESLNILIPTIRKPGSTLVFTWNPLTTEDPVHQYFVANPTDALAAQTIHRHTTFRDIYQLLNPTIRETIQAAESGDPLEYAHVWLGEPVADQPNQIISPRALYAARDRDPQPGPTSIGIDVARYGQDRTALAVKTGNQIAALQAWQHRSIVQTADLASRVIDQHAKTLEFVNVDDTGVGGGLTDLLQQRHGPLVRGVNYAGKPAIEPNRYPNVASELWFHFAAILPELAISPHLDHWPNLVRELTARTWTINTRNQRQIEAKSTAKGKTGGKSPDLADAVLLACYPPPRRQTYNVNI